MANENNELLFIMKMRDEASAVLKKASEAIAEHGEKHEAVTPQINRFKAAVLQAAGGATSWGQALKNVGVSMLALGAPVAAGVVAANTLSGAWERVKAQLGEVIQNTVEYEKSQKALGMALRVTDYGTGMTKAEINEVVDDTAQKSLTDDTDVRNAVSRLLVVGRVARENFQPAIDMSVQLSRIMGTDLASAARIMARAMADPEQGMNALRRSGIILNETEKQRIELAARSGGAAKAQAEALKILEARLGRPGAANTEGLSGALRAASFAWDEFLDQFNDSVLSNAVAGIIHVTAAALSAASKITDFSRALKESRDLAAKGESPSTGGWKLATPEQMLEFDIGEMEKRVADLRKRLDEARSVAAGKTSIMGKFTADSTVSGLEKELKGVTAELEKARTEMAKFDAEKKKALDGSEAAKLVDALKGVDRVLSGAGVGFQDGKIVEKVVINAKADVEGMQRAFAIAADFYKKVKDGQITGEYDAETLRRAEGDMKRANEALKISEDNLKRAGVIAKSREEDEDRLAIARTAQANRIIAEAEQKARDRLRAARIDEDSEEGRAELARARKQAQDMRSAQFGDANAATSREVKYQMDLARAYLTSASAANKLAAEQQAMEAATTGTGNPDARDIRSLEFFKGLVSAAQETRQSLDEFPALEAKVAAATEKTTEFAFGAYEAALAKIRDLKSKMLDDNSPEAQAQNAQLLIQQTEMLDAARRKAGLTLAEQNAQYIANARQEIETNQVKISMAGQSQLAEEKAIVNIEAEREKRKLLALDLKDEEELKRRLALIEDRRQAGLDLAESAEQVRRAQGPMSSYLRETTEGWRAYESATVSALSGTEDFLVSSLMQTRNWQEAMSGLLKQVQADFLKIAIRQNITGPLASWVFGDGGTSGGGGGSGGGGLFSRAFNWIGSMFEDGGIMTSKGKVPLRKYSEGGIANSPQMAIFGEGSVPEAYVPVPSGRIPVELRVSGDGGATMKENLKTLQNTVAQLQAAGFNTSATSAQDGELGVKVQVHVDMSGAMSELRKVLPDNAPVRAERGWAGLSGNVEKPTINLPDVTGARQFMLERAQNLPAHREFQPPAAGRLPADLRLKGGGLGGSPVIHTEVNVVMNQRGADRSNGQAQDSQTMADQARELGAMVTALVNKNLQDQMRPGGLLNPAGSSSMGMMQ